MANKRISNTTTKKYYSIRQKTTKQGRKGQIIGLYKDQRKSASYVKRNFGDVIKKLSRQ